MKILLTEAARKGLDENGNLFTGLYEVSFFFTGQASSQGVMYRSFDGTNWSKEVWFHPNRDDAFLLDESNKSLMRVHAYHCKIKYVPTYEERGRSDHTIKVILHDHVIRNNFKDGKLEPGNYNISHHGVMSCMPMYASYDGETWEGNDNFVFTTLKEANPSTPYCDWNIMYVHVRDGGPVVGKLPTY